MTSTNIVVAGAVTGCSIWSDRYGCMFCLSPMYTASLFTLLCTYSQCELLFKPAETFPYLACSTLLQPIQLSRMGKTMWLEFLSEQPWSKQGHMKRWPSFLESICWFYILAMLGPLWSWSHWFDSRNYWMLSFWYKGLFPVGCCDQWKAIDIGPCFLLQGQSNFPLEGCNYGKNMLLTTLGILGTHVLTKKDRCRCMGCCNLTHSSCNWSYCFFYAWSCSWTKRFL